MFNKKRKLIFLQCVLIFLCSCMCFTACKFGKKPDSTEHIHSFEENVKDDFLVTEATCIQRALYYKSCVCGELSDQTFEYGELAPHDFSGENPDESFLKQSATCT